MIPDIKIEGLDKLIKKLGAATAQEVLEPVMYKEALNLAAWSKKNRLTGRPGLRVVSNRLRSSISVSRSIQRSKFEFFIGTNVKYAAIHEFGGVIHKNARSSLQVFSRKSRGINKGQFKKNPKFGKGFTFKEYDIRIPARPFLRPALEDQENRAHIVNSVTKAINEALSS